MSDYTIQKLKNDEFHLLIPLMKDCFGMQVNIQYFEWKFIHNPAGFVEGFIAVAADGEVAAYYGVIPEVYMINGKKTTIYQSCDTMTHSNHRRKGLFQKLALHCFDQLKNENRLFVIGFGGGQSTPGFIKFGWVQVFKMRTYFYPRIFTFIQFSRGKNIELVNDFTLIEDLVLKSNITTVIHAHKTPESFKWRLSNPLYDYKVLAYKTAEGKYSSYVCYYVTDNKIFLFDFYFENSKSSNALMGNLKKLVSEFKYKAIISFLQEDSSYSQSLKKAGFITNPFEKGPLSEKVPFIFYTNKAELEKYNDKNCWLVNAYDHDAM